MHRLIAVTLVACSTGTNTEDGVRVLSTEPTAVRFLNDTHFVAGIVDVEKIESGDKSTFQQWFALSAGKNQSAATERSAGDLRPLAGTVDTKERGHFLDKGAVALVRASVEETKLLGLPCGEEFLPIGAVGGDTSALAFTACDTDDNARIVFVPTEAKNVVVDDVGIGRPLVIAGSSTHYGVFIDRGGKQELRLYTLAGEIRAAIQSLRAEALLAAVTDDGFVFAIVRNIDTSELTLRSYSPAGIEVVLGTILETPAPVALAVGNAGVYLLTSAGYVLRFAKIGGLLSEAYLEDGAQPRAMSVRTNGSVDVVGPLAARSIVIWTVDTQGNITERKELDPLALSVKK